jgi:DinB superfamily
VHPYTAAVVGHLEDTRAKLRGVVDAVPAQLRGRRPADDRWSVNDVLEHLSLVESLLTKPN